eukprot:6165976-Amphidinium_carterae.1
MDAFVFLSSVTACALRFGMASTATNATYSFSSAPRAVATRRKYREPNQAWNGKTIFCRVVHSNQH